MTHLAVHRRTPGKGLRSRAEKARKTGLGAGWKRCRRQAPGSVT